ncbi:hypothetical protein LB565_09525 [Mesorhizobium sp. CA14]|uniref:hypothetical protein n=1 Tax=Mesorhizobium sp. CA14 TaxID=2876642 RepID=UPI001CCA4FE1|nr:hypothetical protein [Mesorhizobium sp. CA14]MBZ9848222.1 hypothetical protein [Mesorhizobium sp. CA14]
MSDITAGGAPRDPHRLGRSLGLLSAAGHGEGGPASKFVTAAYGFWIFLLFTIMLSASLPLTLSAPRRHSGHSIFEFRSGVTTLSKADASAIEHDVDR